MDERELICHGCRKHAPISTMRYDLSGKFLNCPDCRGEALAEVEEPRIQPLISGGPFGQPKSQKYQCTNCRYAFRRTPTSPVNKCPNCGGAKMLRFEKLSANDLLRMADDDKFRGL